MEVAVCVATYHRPDGLRKLLDSLVKQQGLDGRFGIVVVDNDPLGSAREVVDSFDGAPVPIRYAVEASPGIPAARNRSIAIAREETAGAVAFIDDDEHATPYWLATLYLRMTTEHADAVSGPVEPLFPEEAPVWARRTRLYHRKTFPDGARLDYASTANSMLRLEAIAGIAEPFAPDFRFTGGSDTCLYQSIRARGRSIIWEPSALVYEDVPLSRISLRWITARSYRQGITLARCDVRINPSRWKTAIRTARGLAQLPLGLIECGLSLARKNPGWRRGIVRISRGVGMIAGLVGLTYEEYRRIDERPDAADLSDL